MSEHAENAKLEEIPPEEGPIKLLCQVCGASNSMYPGANPPRCNGQVEELVLEADKKTGQERMTKMVKCNHAAWSRVPGEGESKESPAITGKKKPFDFSSE